MKKILHLVLMAFLAAPSFAQQRAEQVDYPRFMKEITLSNSSEGSVQMSIWMPGVFWNVVQQQNSDITPEATAQIIDAIDDYVIVCVVKADMQDYSGEMKTMSESTMRKKVVLKCDGKSYKPVAYNDLTEEAQLIKDVIEPVFANMLGSLGSGMTILYFDVKDEGGDNIIDPYKKGSFSIDIDGASQVYNLPLSSLFEDKFCPADKAEFPSNYNYCPFHGIELEDK